MLKRTFIVTALCLLPLKSLWATSVLERNLVECTISDQNYYAEFILKHVTLEDGDLNTYQSYTLDYVNGELYGHEVDILGVHEQLRDRIFTTANADSDGVVNDGHNSYQMISEFRNSRVIIQLDYVGKNTNGFDSYEISLDGHGPVFNLVFDKYQEILDGSELYQAYDRPVCTSHFNLDDFVE